MLFKHIQVGELAQQLGAQVEGDSTREIQGVAGLEAAGPLDLSFLANPRYTPLLSKTKAGAVLVNEDQTAPGTDVTLLRLPKPYLAFAQAVTLLAHPPEYAVGSIYPGAHIDPKAHLGKDVTVFPGVYVGPDTVIGDRTVLFPNVVVMERCQIGADCLLYAGVVIREECVLGDRVILNMNVSIGGDGYGFAQDGARHVKIPQVGNVVLGDDVEIGAGSTIDRGALSSTVVGRGTKIDNLVMVGHATEIGEDALLVAQVGVAGSAKIGDRVYLLGRSGVVGHLRIGSDSILYSDSHLTKPMPEQAHWSGNPARPHRDQLRQNAQQARLGKLADRVAALEQRLAAMGASTD